MNKDNTAHIWPHSWKRNADGDMYLGGCKVVDLVQQWGTPLFVYDESDFRHRCQIFAQAFGNSNVHYASKSFLTTHIVRWVQEEGLSLDVCSIGELYIALQAGFPPDKITLHGNNKSEEELSYALTARVGIIVVDSYIEIERIERLAQHYGIIQKVFIRLTTGIEAHTHEYIATAHEDQKFGFSLASGAADRAVSQILTSKHMQLVGLHSHIGSQIFDTQGFVHAAELVIEFVAYLHRKYSASVLTSLQYVDLGGGIGIAYTTADNPLCIATMAQTLQETVHNHCEKLQLPQLTVQVEPGRAISGPAGITLYSVGTIKNVQISHQQIRQYISIDGGMSDNIRPALYGAIYQAQLLKEHTSAALVPSRIVGKHCETGDIIIPNIDLPTDIHVGEIIAIAATGAYCYAMSSSYNAALRPAVISVYEGQSRELMRRETLEDLLRLEKY